MIISKYTFFGNLTPVELSNRSIVEHVLLKPTNQSASNEHQNTYKATYERYAIAQVIDLSRSNSCRVIEKEACNSEAWY